MQSVTRGVLSLTFACVLILSACNAKPDTSSPQNSDVTPDLTVQAEPAPAPVPEPISEERLDPPASVFEMRGQYKVDTGRDCDGYPRMNLTTKDGLCVGLVADISTPIAASKRGLKFPRDLLFPNEQHNFNGEVLIVDMGGWAENKGRLLSLDSNGLDVVIEGLNLPHAIEYGPDGEIYIAEAHRISRVNVPPYKPEGYALEPIITDLPYKRDGKLNLHPLKAFTFSDDKTLWVNSGSQSDRCLSSVAAGRCEDDADTAVVMKFVRGADGQWRENPDDRARGLRNSMGLAAHDTGTVMQAGNGSDFKDEALPPEEINVIRAGANYGWPYCYGTDGKDPEWTSPPMDCSPLNPSHFGPTLTLPAHGAPLDLLYAPAGTLEFKQEKLIVPLHGYRPAGHRILMFDVDENGVPAGEAKQLVSGWHANETRPRGAPVGLTIAPDGSLWGVEDKNKTVFRIAKDLYKTRGWEEGNLTAAKAAPAGYASLQKDVLMPNCAACHAEFKGDANASFAAISAAGWMDKVDGEPELLTRLTAEGRRLMPPGKRLDPDDIRRVRAFIQNLD